ncbi:MAG: hypothetical protein A4E73_00096 [Syntrophaceae bacterium PtaU1.Bin231]|nr:MAG: hypothetical protein A4E73_00096 [Syntrophaceae bacterium PtaU1.Bin231]HOG17375.1 hypothetical protein [Syntrophales bacterium]
MIDAIMVIVYRLIVLLVLGLTAWSALDEEDGYFQVMAAFLVVPLLLRVLMIK